MTLIILKAAVIPLKCYVASGGESSLGLYTNVNRKSGFFGGNRAAVTARALHHYGTRAVTASRPRCYI